MLGAVVSMTVTSNEHPDALPESSVAVQNTLVVPSGKTLPDVGKQAIAGAASQRSVAVAANFTAVPPVLAHSTLDGLGH